MNSRENSTFKVHLSAQARRYLKRSDKVTRKLIATAINTICENPMHGTNIVPLRGFSQKYRYRLKDMRIIYTLNIKERLISVDIIGQRGDVYKK